MLENLRSRSRDESGFTLVELLVVMLILGILAAIAVPSFFNQRDKARDSEAKASVRTAQTAMETYATDNGGAYTNATAVALDAIENTLDVATLNVAVPGTAGALYTVTVTSDNAPNTFSISREADGSSTLACADPGNDGCPSTGLWG